MLDINPCSGFVSLIFHLQYNMNTYNSFCCSAATCSMTGCNHEEMPDLSLGLLQIFTQCLLLIRCSESVSFITHKQYNMNTYNLLYCSAATCNMTGCNYEEMPATLLSMQYDNSENLSHIVYTITMICLYF